MLFDPRCHGEDVGIEDDVLGREAGLLGQQFVGARADRHLAIGGIGLALFVERHHHDRRAVAADEPRLGEEFRLAFLETDGVDDPLPLEVLQPPLEDFPPRRIHHHRYFRDVRLGGDQSEEALHRGNRVEHSFVHVHVDDLGAIVHLMARDVERGLVVPGLDQSREPRRAGDVGALADVHEQGVRPDVEGLETGEPANRRDLGERARRHAGHRCGERPNVAGRRAAAAADDVHEPRSGELAHQRRHFGGGLVVAAERVR